MRALAGCLSLACLATPALVRAQTAAGVDTSPPSVWRFQVNADGSWYENPYFETADQTATAWSTSGYATLSRTSRFRSGSFSIAGFGGVLYYPEIDDFTQPTYGGSLSLDWKASRHTSLNLSQSYSRSNTRNLRELDQEGLPLPTSSVENFATSLGLDHQLTQHWQLGVDGSFTWRRFEEPGLIGGEQLSAGLQLGRRVGRASSIYLAYHYTAAWFEEDLTRVHQGLLGVQKQVDKGVSFELAGGVGYLESTGSFYPAGQASLTARGRRTSMRLSYSRDFGLAFGYGRQMIGDLASAAFSWAAHRKLSLNAHYNFGYRRDAQDESYTVLSHVATVGFGWEIVRNLSFSGSYGWERNETEGFAVVEGQRATASLSYGVEWR